MSTTIGSTSHLGTRATLRRGLELSPELRRGLGEEKAAIIVRIRQIGGGKGRIDAIVIRPGRLAQRHADRACSGH